MLLFIGIEWLMGTRLFNFNTSHVTVYLDETGENKTLELFQYISCYCLSRSRRLRPALKSISIHLMLLFIECRKWNACGVFYFNTSHVTVYQFRLHTIRALTVHFNTSHVTVYQPQCYQHQSLYLISIHLMLLFILSSDRIHLCLPSISIHLMLLFIFMSILLSIKKEYFNTSHVTVYQSYTNGFPSSLLISIHLMLLFILLLTGLRIDC